MGFNLKYAELGKVTLMKKLFLSVAIGNVYSFLRVNVYYYDQYSTTMMINKPALREGYDLSSLKVICIAGSISTAEFKQRMLKIAPLSVVSYKWGTSHRETLWNSRNIMLMRT